MSDIYRSCGLVILESFGEPKRLGGHWWGCIRKQRNKIMWVLGNQVFERKLKQDKQAQNYSKSSQNKLFITAYSKVLSLQCFSTPYWHLARSRITQKYFKIHWYQLPPALNMLNLTILYIAYSQNQLSSASMLVTAKYSTMLQHILVPSNKVRTWWKVVTNTLKLPSPSLIWGHSNITKPLFTAFFTFFKIDNGEVLDMVKCS